MMEYSLDKLVEECKAKSFTDAEVDRVRSAYNSTMVKYEQRYPCPKGVGIASAISYMEDKFRVSYTAGSLTICKIIDDWHKTQGDGRK